MAPPAPKSSAGLLLVAILLGIGGGGGAAWYILQRARVADAAAGPSEVSLSPKYIVHLEGFTVNLADPEETHFLRLTLDLGIDRLPNGADKDKDSSGIPKGRIRDSVLSVLTVCKGDVLLTTEGKQQLKKNLVEVLNRNVPELGVREVYFTEFLVQR